MILYCDTSALIKRYVREDYSDKVDELWADAKMFVISSVAYAESLSALCRKFREGLFSELEYSETMASFKSEYPQIIKVNVTSDLNIFVEELITKYILRGLVAIHLASALLLSKHNELSIHFACFDLPLHDAAKSEGLIIV